MGDTVEFRAGRLYLKEGKLVASTTKGLVRAFRQEDGLVQFEWTLRAAGSDDPIMELLLPGEAEYKRIDGAPGGRVFTLTSNASGAKYFFWMQEPAKAAEKDDLLLARMQQLLAPPTSAALPAPAPLSPQIPAPLVTEESPMPAAETPGMSLVSPFVPAAAAAPAAAAGPIRLEHLQSALVNFPMAQQQQEQSIAPGLTAGLDLEAVLHSDALVPLVFGMSADDLSRFKDLLPEGHSSVADVAELVASPQFQQAVEQFNTALHSRELPSIWMQCDLQWDSSKLQGAVVECFLKAMHDLAKAEAASRDS
mmetsp:Transcript_13264/g.52880  ORF Transcript_13264/g.52880 Transcript_13264/m.52880 type:complete len:308 (+) Transcript_13264:3-926(+)